MPAALTTRRDGSVVTVAIERPPANAINLELAQEAIELFDELAADASAAAVIVTGLPGCFSAGADLKEIPSYDADRQRAMVTAINRMIRTLYGLPKPVVAAVTGHAIAGGMCLAVACDVRLGVKGAHRYGLTEGKAGVPFPANALAVVTSELDAADARRLVLGSQLVDANDALEMGVLDALYEPDALEPTAFARAEELTQIPARTYARTKASLRGEVLAAMDAVLASGSDPCLKAWLDGETAGAAAGLLAKK